jgi:hypothetical protein
MLHNIPATPSLRLAASDDHFDSGLPRIIIVDWGRLGKHLHQSGFRR